MKMHEAFLSRWKEREPAVRVLFYPLSAYLFPPKSRDYGLIAESIAARLGGEPPSLITAWGDPALVLSLSLRDARFPSTPIIAFDIIGTDVAKRARLTEMKSLYVVEMGDFGAKNIELAKTIFPDRKRVVVLNTIGDDFARIESFRKEFSSRFPDLDLVLCVNPSQASADAALREAPEKSMIMNYSPGWVDLTGRFLSGKDFSNSLFASYGLPEFEYIREFIDKGMAGGFGIPVEVWGSNIAEQGLSLVFDGKKPPTWSDASELGRAFVDCAQLARFGVPLSRVPPGAELVNEPPSAWVRYQPILQPGIAVMMLALAASVVAAVFKRREKRLLLEANACLEKEVAERTADLRDSNEELAAANSNLRAAIRRTEEMQENVLRSAREITLGRFAAAMANGLNSPLNAVRSAGAALKSIASVGENGLADYLLSLNEAQRALFSRHADKVVSGSAEGETILSGTDVIELERRFGSLLPGDWASLAADLADSGLAGLDDAALAEFATEDGRAAARALYGLSILVRSAWIIDESVDRAVDVVRTVHDYVSGVETETSGPADLRATVKRALLLFKNRLPASVTLRTEYEDVPEVRGSESMYSRVWIHLIQNALQAMPEGGRLDVSVRKEGDFATVSVGDEGIGIDPSVADRIFEPFLTTKPLAEGMGLGLAYCRRSIESVGGSIEFFRKERGTVFLVRVPTGGSQ